MKTVIFIPARYPSQRFPGKPLAMLTGATGEARSLIHRSWDAARSVDGVDAVYVLTDDDRIAEAAEAFGAVRAAPGVILRGVSRVIRVVSPSNHFEFIS